MASLPNRTVRNDSVDNGSQFTSKEMDQGAFENSSHRGTCTGPLSEVSGPVSHGETQIS